jgi:hypothetical protein
MKRLAARTIGKRELLPGLFEGCKACPFPELRDRRIRLSGCRNLAGKGMANEI